MPRCRWCPCRVVMGRGAGTRGTLCTACARHVSRDGGGVHLAPCPDAGLCLPRSWRPPETQSRAGLTASLHRRYPLHRRAAALPVGGRSDAEAVCKHRAPPAQGKPCVAATRRPPRPAPPSRRRRRGRPAPLGAQRQREARLERQRQPAGPGRYAEHGPGGAAVRRAALRRPQPLQPAGRAAAARHALLVDRRPPSAGPYR